MLEFLEKGATVEQDVLANLKAALPQEAASFLSQLIPTPPLRERQGSGTTATTATEAQPMSRYGQDDVMADQVGERPAARGANSATRMVCRARLRARARGGRQGRRAWRLPFGALLPQRAPQPDATSPPPRSLRDLGDPQRREQPEDVAGRDAHQH